MYNYVTKQHIMMYAFSENDFETKKYFSNGTPPQLNVI